MQRARPTRSSPAIGLRVEPAPPGAGVRFRLEVELGAMPSAFFRAVEETVRETLRQGIYGWEVPDCVGHDDALRLRAAAEPRPSRLRQEHVEHRRATSAT